MKHQFYIASLIFLMSIVLSIIGLQLECQACDNVALSEQTLDVTCETDYFMPLAVDDLCDNSGILFSRTRVNPSPSQQVKRLDSNQQIGKISHVATCKSGRVFHAQIALDCLSGWNLMPAGTPCYEQFFIALGKLII